jgi:hypothetical protein
LPSERKRMNKYDMAVLSAICKGDEPIGWYKIEQRLSGVRLASRDHLPEALRRLTERRLIEEDVSCPGKYRATPLGRATLSDG